MNAEDNPRKKEIVTVQNGYICRQRMKQQLSILIPTYNYACLPLVKELYRQATAIVGLNFEILVAEDGSSDARTMATNEHIKDLSYCRHIVRQENVGRAQIRNILAATARYPWLLFVDSDMKVVVEDFLLRYLNTTEEQRVVYGGNSVGADLMPKGSELKYKYERQAEIFHTPTHRSLSPNSHFNTSNVLIAQTVLERVPFDHRFRTYGYEDVFFGKTLEQAGITVTHIYNPLGFNHYDSNADFLSKTEESLHTLHQFRDELSDLSPIIRCSQQLERWHLGRLFCFTFKLLHPLLRRHLQGRHPSLFLFSLYKLGLYMMQN